MTNERTWKTGCSWRQGVMSIEESHSISTANSFQSLSTDSVSTRIDDRGRGVARTLLVAQHQGRIDPRYAPCR
jgi:hypothetical protein